MRKRASKPLPVTVIRVDEPVDMEAFADAMARIIIRKALEEPNQQRGEDGDKRHD